MEKILIKNNKSECCGCEACIQVCPNQAIRMIEDKEKFRYPVIDKELCVNCKLCERVCPEVNKPFFNTENKYVYGGYNLDRKIRFESTSGGAFSSIVDAFCDENYVIFGAKARGLTVFHRYVIDKRKINEFRKSKYSQSIIGNSYTQVKQFLMTGKKVLFSGTPCQVAGLNNFLRLYGTKTDKLLTVEVVCEGIPTPLYMKKYDQYLENKYGEKIDCIDYRYKGISLFSRGRWDFEAMRVRLKNNKILEVDRWFNPFWSIWLKHLMSRPSCYKCLYAREERTADITLGDLWGVHIYCPELYGGNGGASLIIANNNKGKEIVKKTQSGMYGHELRFEDALRYQGPLRGHISSNSLRSECIHDLESDMSYEDINKKWASNPTLKLMFQKYIWGNRQKVLFWNIKHKLKMSHI